MTAGETEIAHERIDRLHEFAKEAAGEGQTDRAREYVRRARRVAERNRLGLPASSNVSPVTPVTPT